MKKLLLLITVLLFAIKIQAACPAGYNEVIIKIIPDMYAYETSWNIADNQGNIVASGDSIGDTLCIANGSCNMFTIMDAYGDGIYLPGGYWIYIDGVLYASGNAFGFSAQHTFNCPQGSFCTQPIPLTTGAHTATFDDTWYDYTPTVTGTYSINTCGLNTCDTKIWIYSACPNIPYQENLQGTFAFNDDNNCGTQAVLNVILISGTHYFIRIGDNLNSCSSDVNFEFSYVGPVQGCTDVTACNYNPQASVDDGSCIYFPNAGCAGPDLQIDSAIFVQSLGIQSQNANTCDITEGCLLGYGTRYVITFTSRVNNIGTLDYLIGNPGTQPGMFNLNNCHGHAHYEGYGDYRLFDSGGNLVPAGHKNGFCVIDLCGSIHQYTCSNMGVSAGCWDEYGAGTQCQWIDITDVPTGDYRIAVIINSMHLPDALGRNEINYANNATQVCMHITHNLTGAPTYTLLPNCLPFVDCSGIPGGASVSDCNGVCNGPTIYGNVFPDTLLNAQDIYTYLDIMESGYPATPCNDLNGDNKVSIYDPALANWCRRSGTGNGSHNHCNFPRNIQNPGDIVSLAISDVNFTYNYVDVEILNSLANVKAFQFSMSGIKISSVVSLASPVNFPVDARFTVSNGEVFGISLQDSSLQRSSTAQPLLRIYFSEVTDTLICISSIREIINQNGERTVNTIYGGCYQATITTSVPTILKYAELVILPNPAQEKSFIHLSYQAGSIDEILIVDVTGKSFMVPKQKLNDEWYELDLHELPVGVYFVSVKNTKSYGVTRFIKL